MTTKQLIHNTLHPTLKAENLREIEKKTTIQKVLMLIIRRSNSSFGTMDLLRMRVLYV